MKPLARLEAVAAPFLHDDVDTDQLIPVPSMVAGFDGDLGRSLFAHARFDEGGRPRPDFVLNQPPYDRAQMLIVGTNFGCGSSREHAVWALADFGIRCVIGVSFADIFAQNCRAQGLVLVRLPRTDIDALARIVNETNGAARVALDVAAQTLTAAGRTWRFEIEATLRDRLLAGQDEIEATLAHREAIEQWERKDRVARPWIHRPLSEVLDAARDDNRDRRHRASPQ